MVALLMIGGEFDLSAGVMTGSAGLTMGLLATEVGMNIWLAIVITLAAATAIGFINGYMVMRTKLPSFIVTLATFFILQGLNLGVTKAITDQVSVSGIDTAAGYASANKLFGGSFWAPHDFKVTVLWWIAITILGTWVLTRTRVGNWIFGVGGDANAARNVGVPVTRREGRPVHGDVVRVRADRDHDRPAAGVHAGRPGRRRGVPVHHRRGRRRLRADRRLRLGGRRVARRDDHRHGVHRHPVLAAGTPTGATCSSA